jgi:AcrR family transcriptional regulator
VTSEGATLTARQRQGVVSRGRILDAAEDLVAQQGFAATSVSQIAAASGLPASSLYWHFDSKEALLGAVVERGARRWALDQPRWSAFDGDLAGYLDAVGKGADERPVFLRLLMLLALERQAATPGATRTVAVTVWEGALSSLREILRHAFDLSKGRAGDRGAERLARFMLATMDGAVLDAHIDPEGTDIAQLVVDLHTALVAIAASMKGRVRR